MAAAPVLPRGFYQRPTEEVARDLLGKLLVRTTPDGIAAVRIDEVEAYLGVDDPACHTYRGRRTSRNETMWGEAGFAYIYLVYGIHSCLNAVTVGEGAPEAVLIRGGRVVTGRESVRRRRGVRVPSGRWADGPGKLCQALDITRALDGTDLCGVADGLSIRGDGYLVDAASVCSLPRIGVEYAGGAARWPLRFTAELSPSESSARRASREAHRP